MSTKWLWGVLITFVVVGLASGILYFRYRTLITKLPPSELAPRDSISDSLLITHSKANPNQKEYLRTSLLNKLKIEDFNFEEIEVGGESKTVLNLEVSFIYQGRDRKLTITFVDSVLVRKLSPQGIEDEGVISVANLNLAKQQGVNVGLSYIPAGISTTKEELKAYCSEKSNEICLNYLDLGFGEKPIDFNKYLDEILMNEDAIIDYKVTIPSSLYLLGG